MFLDFPQIPTMPKVTVIPGAYYATKDVCVISTLLGSCVAACLWDPVAKIAGMNHFLLANRRYARDMPLTVTEAGRYGVQSMEILINAMIHLGADKRRIRAKAFGGGKVLETLGKDNFNCVGSVNERFIREFLATEGIPLDSDDLGGDLGRVIRFRTDTYAVYRRFVKKTSTYLVEREELGFWKKSIKRQREEEEAQKKKEILF
ncbi:MAG TPA: chemotaxis protein CheD [Treponemataceae bacterium]|nr:chemotaxis protein CheD [Treponemataceae bacterium]